METQGHVAARLDQQLREEVDLDIREYETLLYTFEAGAEGIRMTDLSSRILLSKSGLTTLVDRLEERGLMARTPDPSDRRAIRVGLTDMGEDTFRHAAGVHMTGIKRWFADHLTDDEAAVVADLLERVRDHA